jgi:predicted dehydrogenase
MTNYRTVIYGSEGTLLAEPEKGRLLLATEKRPEGEEIEIIEPDEHLSGPIAHFLHGIQSEKSFHPLCRAGHGRDVQEILELGMESAATGQRVALSQLEPMD